MSSFIKNGKLYIEAEPLSETINAHDLGIAGGYIIEQTMGERIERLKDENAKLLWLVTDMCACFRIGAEREGVSKQWCYELFDTYTGKLRELGIKVN